MDRIRVEMKITGIVQGVGFRPFLHRIAGEFGLDGWVINDSAGVKAELEGQAWKVWAAVERIRRLPPPAAVIADTQVKQLPPAGLQGFEIRESDNRQKTAGLTIPPDLALCPQCRREMSETGNRRYRHPFINCTDCGPRYSIIRKLPYDRPTTVMAGFKMCTRCEREYNQPTDRRHHAQPIACPECGPSLRFLDHRGVERKGDPVQNARKWLKQGKIVAVQGLGGFHLACLASRPRPVRRLRKRKGRESRPLAVMVHDLDTARRICHVERMGEHLLTGTDAPIVLLPPNDAFSLPREVSGGSRQVGVMLAYTPVHFLLTERMPPLVMTSGNRAGEPIITEPQEALEQLAGIADAFLLHNRPIERRCDDSVVQIAGSGRVIRRSRGMVPREMTIPVFSRPLLACGPGLKNTFCLASGNRAVLSPHMGDLAGQPALEQYEKEIKSLIELTGIQPVATACDMHPDYLSTIYARSLGLPCLAVQHHHAHIASVLAEHGRYGQVIGVVFDGAGWGTDGRIWGGEFLIAGPRNFERAGHLAYMPQPGGDRAAMEPWRMAAVCLEMYCSEQRRIWPGKMHKLTSGQAWPFLWQAARRGIATVETSSAGRLFDAVSAILGLCHRSGYEGEAAVLLEAHARPGTRPYQFGLEQRDGLWIADPGPIIREIVADLSKGVNTADIAGRFHGALARMISTTCTALREQTGINEVALSGGVFDNRMLTSATMDILGSLGFTVLLNRQVPGNDGGVALGQALVAALNEGREEEGNIHVSCHTWPGD